MEGEIKEKKNEQQQQQQKKVDLIERNTKQAGLEDGPNGAEVFFFFPSPGLDRDGNRSSSVFLFFFSFSVILFWP